MMRKISSIIMIIILLISMGFQNAFALESEKDPPDTVNMTIHKPYIIFFGGEGKTYKYIAEVDGKRSQAYALESDKKMPGDNHIANRIPNDDKLVNIMYYCFQYPEYHTLIKWLKDNGYSDYTDVNALVALSQVMLMYANDPKHAFQGWNQVAGHSGGTLDKSYQEMVIKAYNHFSTLKMPEKRNQVISFTDSTATWSDDCFKSSPMILKGSPRNFVNYKVPSDMTLHMDGKEYAGGSTVQIEVYVSFYLTTKNKDRRNTTYESPQLLGDYKSYVPYKTVSKEDEQTIIFFASTKKEYASFKVKFGDTNGYASIDKKSESNKDITSICPKQYSNEGATYGIYQYREDAQEDKNRIKTLTTDENGALPKIELDPKTNNGMYYLRELTPSKGFIANPNIYEFAIKANETTKLTVKSEPYVDYLNFEAKKQIKEGLSDFQKYLKGAEYTVRYYPSILNTKEEINQQTPMRTWVFKTDEEGIFRFGDKWKLSGDDLFKDDEGKPIGLIGTYTFEETRAPLGFEKNDGIEIRHIEEGTVLENLNGDNSVIFKEPIDKNIKHKLTINRKIKESDVYKPFGEPISIIEISCKNIQGQQYTLRKSLSLKDYTLKDGYYIAQLTFDNLEAGEYTVKEIKTSRYKTKEPLDISANATETKEGICFELVNTKEGEATYQSEVSKWNNLSYATVKTNIF